MLELKLIDSDTYTCTLFSLSFFLAPHTCTFLQWAVYSRNIIRTSNGLRVIGELLNNGHDAVVRAAATALRNLAIDLRIKANLGTLDAL